MSQNLTVLSLPSIQDTKEKYGIHQSRAQGACVAKQGRNLAAKKRASSTVSMTHAWMLCGVNNLHMTGPMFFLWVGWGCHHGATAGEHCVYTRQPRRNDACHSTSPPRKSFCYLQRLTARLCSPTQERLGRIVRHPPTVMLSSQPSIVCRGQPLHRATSQRKRKHAPLDLRSQDCLTHHEALATRFNSGMNRMLFTAASCTPICWPVVPG